MLFANPMYVKNENIINDKYASSSFNEDLDKFIINSKNAGGKYLDSKLKRASLIKIDDVVHVKADYDVSVQYVYKNAKMIAVKKISLLHPIIIDDNKFILPNIKEYLEFTRIIPESEDYDFIKIRDIDTTRKLDDEVLFKFGKTVEQALKEFNKTIENEDIKSEEELKYFPYIEFDDMGYAYIKGTKEKLTSEMNPIIIYDPIENVSIVEYVDFINGRFISRVTKIKNGKNLNLEDLATKNGSEYIKHLISDKVKLGVRYLDERTIAELVFKDGKMVDCKILP